MNSAKQVNTMIAQWRVQGMSGADIAWNAAKACEGWPYVFGAWGDKDPCTLATRKRRYKDDYKTIKTACPLWMGKQSSCDGCKWHPDGEVVYTFDCRGFTDWCLRQGGVDLYGDGCTTQWNHAANWARKGSIDTMPKDQLVCLFQRDPENSKSMMHTGLGMNNETVECQKGVQYFKSRNAKWTDWAVPAGMDGGGVEPVPAPKPTLRRGNRGVYVTLMQTELIQRGYDCGAKGADGIFGAGTETAVKAFQKDHGLNADGICGPLTWDALDHSVDIQLYTVHIPKLPLYKAEALVNQYTGAWMTTEGGNA